MNAHKSGANKNDQARIVELFKDGVSASDISNLLMINIATVEAFKPKTKKKKKKTAKPKKEAE